MSTPSSWQQWVTEQRRKHLFAVSVSHSTTNVPTPQLSSSPAKSDVEIQRESETITRAPIPIIPQHPPPITSSNQPKPETSTSHHPLIIAALPRSTSTPPTPPKKRPETTDVVARRLIGRALGINLAQREGEGKGERFGINPKTKRQPQTQTRSAEELELVKKMEEVDIS
jgi:hypothetical protein